MHGQAQEVGNKFTYICLLCTRWTILDFNPFTNFAAERYLSILVTLTFKAKCHCLKIEIAYILKKLFYLRAWSTVKIWGVLGKQYQVLSFKQQLMFHNAITLYSAYSKQYFKAKLPYNSQDSFSILHTYPDILPAWILLHLEMQYPRWKQQYLQSYHNQPPCKSICLWQDTLECPDLKVFTLLW